MNYDRADEQAESIKESRAVVGWRTADGRFGADSGAIWRAEAGDPSQALHRHTVPWTISLAATRTKRQTLAGAAATVRPGRVGPRNGTARDRVRTRRDGPASDLWERVCVVSRHAGPQGVVERADATQGHGDTGGSEMSPSKGRHGK